MAKPRAQRALEVWRGGGGWMLTGERRMSEAQSETANSAGDADAALYARFLEHRAPEDFEALVERLHGFAYSVALCICSNPALADEAVQETFLLLAQSSHLKAPPREVGAFRGWFYKVVVNVARHSYRSERRTIMRAQNPAFLERAGEDRRSRSEPDGPGGPQRQEELAALRQAMNDLSEDQRLPLVLHYLEGLSQSEIGQIVGVSTSHVSRRITRGLEMLRVRMLQAGVTISSVSLPVLLGRVYHAPPVIAGELARSCLAGAGRTPVYIHALRHSARAAKPAAVTWPWIVCGTALVAVAAVSMNWGRQAAPPVSPPTNTTPPAEVTKPDPKMLPLHRRWNFDDGPAPEIERASGEWAWQQEAGKGTLVCRGGEACSLLLPVEVRDRPFKVTLRLFPPKQDYFYFGASWSDGVQIPSRATWSKEPMIMNEGKASVSETYFVGKLAISACNGRLTQVIEYDAAYPCSRICIQMTNTMALQYIEIEEVSENRLPTWALAPEAALKANKVRISKEHFNATLLTQQKTKTQP